MGGRIVRRSVAQHERERTVERGEVEPFGDDLRDLAGAQAVEVSGADAEVDGAFLSGVQVFTGRRFIAPNYLADN
jgi:hypothetical protein